MHACFWVRARVHTHTHTHALYTWQGRSDQRLGTVQYRINRFFIVTSTLLNYTLTKTEVSGLDLVAPCFFGLLKLRCTLWPRAKESMESVGFTHAIMVAILKLKLALNKN